MAIMTVIDYRRLRELALFGYAATVFLLVVVLGIGVQVKGAQARFDVGPFQLQPGELAKLFVILVLAGYCAMHRGELDVRHLAVALVDRWGPDRAHHVAARPRHRPRPHVHRAHDVDGRRRARSPPRDPPAPRSHGGDRRREPRSAEGLPNRTTDLIHSTRAKTPNAPGTTRSSRRSRSRTAASRVKGCSRAPRPTAPTSRNSTPTSSSPSSARSSASSVAPRCSPSSR